MSYYYFDVWGMPLIRHDPNSWKDSIGRLMEIEYANNGLTQFNLALDDCLYYDNDVAKLKRHPGHDELASRDHWSYFIQYMKNTSSPEFFDEFIKKVKPMRGMTLWFKALTGNKRAEWWFYTIYNLGAYVHNFLDWAIIGIGNLGPERDNNWWITDHNGSMLKADRTRWERMWAWIWGKVCPFYPVQNRAWQLKFMPENPRKEKQKRIYLKRTDYGNLIVRILFGDKTITQCQVYNYPEMAGDRSGVRLNKSCDRWIFEIEDGYKRKLLKKLISE